jgi:hypothetical protein
MVMNLLEKIASIGIGYWQTPSGEIIKCGDFHENEAFKQLFNFAQFKDGIDKLFESFTETDIPHLARMAALTADNAGLLLPEYLRELLNSDAKASIKESILQLAEQSSSSEMVNRLLSGESNPMISMYLEQGAIRYRVLGDNIYVEFLKNTSVEDVLNFIQSVGGNPRTQLIIEDKSSGKSKKVSLSNLFEIKSLSDLFRSKRKTPLWRMFGASKYEKLLRFATLIDKYSKYL